VRKKLWKNLGLSYPSSRRRGDRLREVTYKVFKKKSWEGGTRLQGRKGLKGGKKKKTK